MKIEDIDSYRKWYNLLTLTITTWYLKIFFPNISYWDFVCYFPYLELCESLKYYSYCNYVDTLFSFIILFKQQIKSLYCKPPFLDYLQPNVSCQQQNQNSALYVHFNDLFFSVYNSAAWEHFKIFTPLSVWCLVNKSHCSSLLYDKTMP